jgi:hypothetical protein
MQHVSAEVQKAIIRLKILLAIQTMYINRNINTRKVLSFNENIYFKQECLKNIIPHYAKLKIPPTPLATKFTKIKAKNVRIKDEIKFLYFEKTSLY